MSSPHQASAIDSRLLLVHLPPLGLPDPAGDFVRVLAVVGNRDECFELLDKTDVSKAPLRPGIGNYKIIEVEIDGAVWFIPTTLRSRTQTVDEAEVFAVDMQRVRASALPAGKRIKMESKVCWVLMDRDERGQLVTEFGGFTMGKERQDRSKLSDEEYLKTLTEGLGLKGLCLEGVQLFRRCSETTPEQRKARPLPQSHEEGKEQAEERASPEETAHKIWFAMMSFSINEDWRKKIQQDRVAAGLRAPGPLTPDEVGIRPRISPEKYEDFRGIDYALIDNNGRPSPEDADWIPLPEEAFDPKWVRTGVNLMRYAVYRDLFTKDDWPPWPTTLMIENMGKARGEL